MPRKLPHRSMDRPLPRTLTAEFISDFNAILEQDCSGSAKYLSTLYLTKYLDEKVVSSTDRRLRAIGKWLHTEERNAQTNQRLIALAGTDYPILPGVSIKRFIGRMSSIIEAVLNHEPSLDFTYGDFSGGASTSKGRARSHPATKFLDKADVTRPAYPVIRDLIRGTRWDEHLNTPGLEPRFVEGNVMFTVPKSSDIDRVACKEPDLNMFFQKALGNQVRRLLKRVGIDLNDQNVNGELARTGSIDGLLMTIDLSSASDSVSRELVRLALPASWYHYMDLFRSHLTVIDEVRHTNEMFSSMGNGFTFELESLLFYAITRTVSYFGGYRGRISVYGDDIIAPTVMYDDLVSALTMFGFSVNEKKSFHTGTIRESCGKHWDAGVDISPFFLRGAWLTMSDLILTLNQLTSWASRGIDVMDPRYEGLWLKYREYVDESVWGGFDLTSRESLVTGHRPRQKLTFATKERRNHGFGELLLWLFRSLDRDEQGCLFITDSMPQSFARLRRNRHPLSPVSYDVPVFLSNYEKDDVTVKANR